MDYEDLWDSRAPHFETDYAGYSDDVAFFRAELDRFDGPPVVCELGAGTLRLVRRLHGHYRTYYAVDLSSKMLEEGLDTLDAEQREAVETIHASMSDLSLPERVDLVFCMGNSFFMLEDEEKEATLRRVASSLRPEGRFVLEVYNPAAWRDMPERRHIHLRTVTREEGDDVVLSFTQRIDEEEKVNHMTWFREQIEAGTGLVRKEVFPIEFRFLEPDQVVERVGRHFDVEATFGSFERDPFDPSESRRLIVSARPGPAAGR